MLFCISPAAGFWLQRTGLQALMGMLKLHSPDLPWHHRLGSKGPMGTADTSHLHPMQTLQHNLQCRITATSA
jgi:hypothetical protein